MLTLAQNACMFGSNAVRLTIWGNDDISFKLVKSAYFVNPTVTMETPLFVNSCAFLAALPG